MHLYNAWLPPPVAEETKKEKESFARVVKSVKESYHPQDPDSVYSTLKWISALDLFIKAKSDLNLEDVATILEFGLDVFHASSGKVYVQVRWGNVLVKILNKYRKKLSLTIQWRPLYDALVQTHFTRSTGPEGWRIKQRHFENVTSLVRSCRRFFPPGSAFEIWSEFSSLLENPWHNSSFEGSGFVRLFLPTNVENQEFFSQDWVGGFITIWGSVPYCHFWNSQFTAILARVIKNYDHLTWEPLLPILFTRFLNMFEVPVGNVAGSYPFSVDAPRNMRFLFSNKTSAPSKAIAKSIVYLLRPHGLAQEHLTKLVNLLEQYYHPSNGGHWTYSLERFLFYLVIMFQKRLQHEQQSMDSSTKTDLFLGREERRYFVSVVLKLIERGQYSKNEQLSKTVAAVTSILSYIDPSLVLPFVVSRFNMALNTMTATHQLKTAIISVAYSGRSLFLSSLSAAAEQAQEFANVEPFSNLLLIILSNALLGMDANDPPKTLATMQLIGSIFSNMAALEDSTDELSPFSTIRFSEWLDEFLCRLFSLLLHLEPSSVVNEGLHTLPTSGTFLVEDGPFYFCVLEILLGRLSKSLYSQALKKISKFFQSNILPGAIAEVGLLCCACVHSNPEEAVANLIEPMLSSVISSMKGVPGTGFGGRGNFRDSDMDKEKITISPALETAIDYQLKVLSIAISYGGPHILHCRTWMKEAIALAFESPSWKVNGGGDYVLRSLLGSLVLYYPLEQYSCIMCHPDAALLEKWISTKSFCADEPSTAPKWHIPVEEEVSFANELLDFHLLSALDELLKICRDKLHTDSGKEKDHLKVTLLRVDSSLQGVSSCLPDFKPSFMNSKTGDPSHNLPLIAGSIGSRVGGAAMRERAAETMHTVFKYLLEKKSDDSTLLILIVRIMDALVNYGSIEYDEWSHHKQAWKLESPTIVEPPVNFVISSHAKGKRRPRWALVDEAYMHNTWRSSQSSFHLYRTNGNVSPSDFTILLMDDLLQLALHSYETVRSLAGKSLLKMIKRWPSMVSRCMPTLTENLANPDAPEHAVLGSCTILSTQTVLKHLTLEPKAFTSFIYGILKSSHHETLKAQKAINELFVKFNIHFAGVSRSILKTSNLDEQNFDDLISQIGSMSLEANGLHWRYNLMANRVILLLVMASKGDPLLSSKIFSETAGHFLKNLKSQLPQTRILAISALNTLLHESPYKTTSEPVVTPGDVGSTKSSIEGALMEIFQEEGFFGEVFDSLSHVHVTSDGDGTSSRGITTSFQSSADRSITFFYFDFTASWPRTPNWITLLGTDSFYSNFARIFKRLVQECGMPVVLALRGALVEFANSKERSKQSVAAEALAGILHSDVDGLLDAWDSWIMNQFQKIVVVPAVESLPEWASCIRYALTEKGKHGTRVPLLREKIMDCLLAPLPQSVMTSVIAKRYVFLAASFIEVSAPRMGKAELLFHRRLLDELLMNMSHPSAQVREAVGVALCVVCSNIQLYVSVVHHHLGEVGKSNVDTGGEWGGWSQMLSVQATARALKIQNSIQLEDLDVQSDAGSENGLENDVQEDMKWMETLFHFVIASLKSGRSSHLVDTVVQILLPVISLQETSNKDLSTLAKASFELLKWSIFEEPHLPKVVTVILQSANDSNWRTRSATLTYLRSFMYRHIFILSHQQKKQIWETVEKLLIDSQVEVREHAAAVLAALMKGGDEKLVGDFRERVYAEADLILKKKRQRKSSCGISVATVHGAALALGACVLSVPYDMPSWLPDHVTLLARFVTEPTPVRSTVTKAVAEFRRTHADTWNLQQEQFTEEQLEVLADTSSSSSYFA